MGMIAKVEILGICNVAFEMDIEDIFDICCDANQPGARVDYLPEEAFEDKEMFRNGAVVIWAGHTTSQEQLVKAVIDYLKEE